MKIITIVILAALAYGVGRFMISLFKEFGEIIAEAWHNGETG
ncbi:MAG: hypothetical protein PHR94_13915 [Methylomonas lenta]|nr:hypothetical protein [Methylomonas lenta]